MSTITSRISFEEFVAMPDQPGKQELLDGEVIELPPAKPIHSHLCKRFFKLLDRIVTELQERGMARNLGEVFIETGYRLSRERCVQPDVSINHRDQSISDYYNGAPALAIEVVSEANTARHLEMKVRAYLEAGALEVWLVYPESRSVWVHRQGSDVAVRRQGSLTTDLLPGVTLDLAQLLAVTQTGSDPKPEN
jgi:Uma2 family endonuclease